ncbi:hypothetical protein LX36DRAFT_656865 [Colletotrichum falcatum]|nr:hypothetical protein LX36DRAFT_656865 [Colletotrichum falcatum]
MWTIRPLAVLGSGLFSLPRFLVTLVQFIHPSIPPRPRNWDASRAQSSVASLDVLCAQSLPRSGTRTG